MENNNQQKGYSLAHYILFVASLVTVFTIRAIQLGGM
jgi:hypothetical protein